MLKIRLQFWGTRGSVPGFDNKSIYYGGNTSCVSITVNETSTIILDAGSGIRKCGEWLKNKNHSIIICLTHLHWDHIQGFPFFMPMQQDRDIYFYSALGKPGLQHCLNQMGINTPLNRPQQFGIICRRWLILAGQTQPQCLQSCTLPQQIHTVRLDSSR